MASQGKRMVPEYLIKALENLYASDLTVKITVGSINNITSEDLNSLECGDIVLKEDSTSETTPFAYSLTPNRNYTVTDEDGFEDTPIAFNQLANCSFAIVETENDNQVNVLFAGTLSNIKRSAEAASKDANILKGYGSTSINELGALEQAGYFKFVLPTLLWQCGLALLISGFVAVFFYFTWTYEEETKTPKKLKKNKAKK